MADGYTVNRSPSGERIGYTCDCVTGTYIWAGVMSNNDSFHSVYEYLGNI